MCDREDIEGYFEVYPIDEDDDDVIAETDWRTMSW